jgi:hypothetical protein
MNHTAAICDRCGAVFEQAPSLVRIESGPLRVDRPSVSLCGNCTTSFGVWLTRDRNGPPAAAVNISAGPGPMGKPGFRRLLPAWSWKEFPQRIRRSSRGLLLSAVSRLTEEFHSSSPPPQIALRAQSDDPRLHPPPGSSLTRGEEEARVRNLIIFSIIFGTVMLLALIAFALLP